MSTPNDGLNSWHFPISNWSIRLLQRQLYSIGVCRRLYNTFQRQISDEQFYLFPTTWSRKLHFRWWERSGQIPWSRHRKIKIKQRDQTKTTFLNRTLFESNRNWLFYEHQENIFNENLYSIKIEKVSQGNTNGAIGKL